MMFIDSHCHLDHLNLDKYNGDLARALQQARSVGVEKILSIGVGASNARTVIELAENHDGLYASVGAHPLEKQGDELSEQQLLKYATHEKVVAIGECGLDYHYSPDNREEQVNRFRTHLVAAAKSQLPVIVHSREARSETLGLIKRYGDHDVAGVLHCFTESLDMAILAIEMNYFISISGIVTFKNASDLREVVRQLPMERLLIETDAPYLAPIPYRGKPNEPSFLPEVARCIAEIKGVSVDEVAEVTSSNFFRLFSKAL